MDLNNIISNEISQGKKNHVLYGSIYMKCPEKANP